MSIQWNLLDIGMQLNGAKDEFYAECKEPRPDSDMLGQVVEDFREALGALDGQVQSLRQRLRRMEEVKKQAELQEA